MPRQMTVLNVFVSSPGDMHEERKLLEEVVHEINRSEGVERGVLLMLWKWEQDAVRRVGVEPQPNIDDQLPDYDIYLGIIGATFGTPTGDGYASGTEKEFRDALARVNQDPNVWILCYFRTGLPAPDNVEDIEQWKRVVNFRRELHELGLYQEYSSVRGSRDAFMEKIEFELRKIVRATKPIITQLEQLSPSDQPTVYEEDDEDLDDTPEPGTATMFSGQFGFFEPNCALDERDKIVERSRRALFDVITPTYLLDPAFHFLDWNTAFDQLIAKPLKLNRQMHALEFVDKLKNAAAVIERSKDLFGYAKKNPIIDIEPLVFKHPDFGIITFRKIAAQIIERHGKPMAWSVTLNIEEAGSLDGVWNFLEKRLKDEFNWTRYAVSYDRLLIPFRAYNSMLDRAVSLMGDARLCVDLGAGTGNGTLRLLQSNPERIVWSVDSNESMLQYLRTKVDEAGRNDESILNRLTTVKGNVERLAIMKNQHKFFDAALMINVLYAVENPQECLHRAYELLKPAGLLVLTCPHKGTNVPKLFSEMRRDLTRQGLFQSLDENFEEAKRAHKRMDHLIHRNSLDEIYSFIDKAGFDIIEKVPEYVDSVMLIKAEKRDDF